MNLFNDSIAPKLKKDDEAYARFHSERQSLQIISSADGTSSSLRLLKIKSLFQRMLPQMPCEYIIRQVFDNKHCTLVLSNSDNEIIGAVCYRPAFDYKFIEIVFFAIDSAYHISGYGTFLFNCFKEVCKLQYEAFLRIGNKYKDVNRTIFDLGIFNGARENEKQPILECERNAQGASLDTDKSGTASSEQQRGVKRLRISDSPILDRGNTNQEIEEYTDSTILYLLTYADNSAIGFFKKQGFTQWPVSTEWVKRIKDYGGGLLMEGKVYKGINYLQRSGLIKAVQSRIFKKMEEINDYHILRDERDIEETKQCYGGGCADAERTSETFLRDFIHFIIWTLQSNSSSWPFLEPVDTALVPDYLSVIEHPMDFSTILTKHRAGQYGSLREFADDIHLVVHNCLTYNSDTTQYYKCGQNIQRAFDDLIRKYETVIEDWGYQL